MFKKKYIYFVLVLCLSSAPFTVCSQSKPLTELKVNLNEDGSAYLKWTFLNQVWIRSNESNPGTTVLGNEDRHTFDIGLRRTRIQFFGQLDEHVFFYTQFGQNNFNYLSQNGGNRKLQVFFHDALGEYKVWKDTDKLKIGAGLTIANGLSRFSQPSISSIMTMDVPVFAQATVDQTDEFSRKLSVYLRGQLGKVDYRLVLSDPFPVTTNGQPKPVVNSNATFSTTGHTYQYQGFFMYQFCDKESHTTPYMTGTYLGSKRVLNLEGGFIYQHNATMTGITDGGTGTVSGVNFYDMKLFSLAMYLDTWLNKTLGTALSAYAGYFNTDFGKGYLRYNGIMNPADGVTPGHYPGSHGNAFPMFGTGRTFYAQAGYLMRKDLLGKNGTTMMPYCSVMVADLERLVRPENVYSAGVNWFLRGHNRKITLDYQLRPAFQIQGNVLEQTSTRSQLLLQYQVFF